MTGVEVTEIESSTKTGGFLGVDDRSGGTPNTTEKETTELTMTKETEKNKTPPKEKNRHKKDNDDEDDGSVGSSGSSAVLAGTSSTNWLGKKKKKSRAVYQSEIDALKLQLAAVEAAKTAVDEACTAKTQELALYQAWASKSPWSVLETERRPL